MHLGLTESMLFLGLVLAFAVTELWRTRRSLRQENSQRSPRKRLSQDLD